jgi:RND family efflux transporter MFP subunit
MKTHTDYLDDSAPAREGAGLSEPPPNPNPPHGNFASWRKPAKPPGFRPGKLFYGVVIVVIVAFVIGFVPRWRERSAVRKETSELAMMSVDVTTPAPSKAAVPLTFSGEVKALAEAAIHARANGYVRRWLVDIGAHVEKDQLLAELDTPEVERDLAQARAELAQAEAARTLAGATAKRWKDMLGARTVSAQEAEEKMADFALKKASADAASAKVERMEKMLGFAKITAPFAGTVTMRTLDVGQLVTAGAGRELFRIAQSEKLRVFVRVPQNYARAIATGQTAELLLAEHAGHTIEAKIVRTAETLDAASRTLLTELEVDNAKGEVLAGSYVQVRFKDAKPDAVLSIPANALLFRIEGSMVGVVGADHRVRLKKVGLGRDFGATVEVLEGVTAADRVIVNPPDSLVEGAEVRAVQTADAAKN